MSTPIPKRLFPAFLVAGSVLAGSVGFAALPAFAAGPGQGLGEHFSRPAVVGKVAAISGDILTVTSMTGRMAWGHASSTPSDSQTTTYSVNASDATVMKDGQSSSLSSVAVGDMVMIQGTISGTSVVATSIEDGMGMMRRGPGGFSKDHASSTPPTSLIKGNGEPVIGGTVSAVSGSSLTVTAKAGETYAVDASSATIVKSGVTSATLSNVSIGDSVIVQGSVNGTSVTASSVLDQGAPRTATSTSHTNPGGSFGVGDAYRGFSRAIGGFFSKLFGFF